MGDILDQDEIDALMSNMGELTDPGPRPAEDGERYDFGRQDYAVHRLIPALSLVHEQFADLAKEAFRGWVPALDQIRPERLSVMKFGEIKRRLVPPCDITAVKAAPLGAPMYLVAESDLVFTLVDRFFGGSGKVPGPRTQADFSPAEHRFMDTVSRALMPVLQQAWRLTLPLSPSIEARHSDLRYLDELSDQDMLLATPFTLVFANLEATLWMLMPWAAIDPIRDSLGQGPRSNRQEQDERWMNGLQEGVLASSVDIVATLAQVTMTLARVADLKVGDILPIEQPSTVKVSVADMPMMSGRFGVHEGKVAVSVDRILLKDPQGR